MKSLAVTETPLAALIAASPGTAASHVPLVVFHDWIEGRVSQPIRHVDFGSLFIVGRGRGLHVIDRTPYAVSRGDVYVMRAGSEHRYTEGRQVRVHAIHFGPDIFDEAAWQTLAAMPGFDSLFIGDATGHRLHLSPAAYTGVVGDLAELWSEWRKPSIVSALLIRALFLRLVIKLARFAGGEPLPTLQPPVGTVHRDEIVAAAVQTIDLEYATELRVERLAAAAHLSRSRFTRVFTEATGHTPLGYIRHVRLERAKMLLITTTMPISEIAVLTGFTSSAYFARSFKSTTGTTPGEFRSNP